MNLKSMHDEKLDSLAFSYGRDGFDVLKEPKVEQLPFDLGGYRPDLIATKGETRLIVEIKTSSSGISIDRFQSIAEEISKHSGWRFLLVTLDDVDISKIPTTNGDLPTWSQLINKIKQVELMLGNGEIEPATLYLWSIFESALRKQAIAQNIPVERLPAAKLLNHMYTQGEISVDQVDALHELMRKRNRIAHGANEAVDAPTISALTAGIKSLVTEWTGSALAQTEASNAQ